MVSTAYGAERILRADIRHRPPEMIVDGKITSGPLKEILEDAAKQLDYSIEWRSAPFFESLKGLRSGEVDIVPRTIRKPDREDFINFLGPISTQQKDILFLVRKGQESVIRSYQDLRKLTVGVKEGTAYFPAFDSDVAITKKPSTGGDYGLARLFIEGGVDTIAILDRGAMESALAGLGYDGHAYAKFRHVRKLDNYFGMSKKSRYAEIYSELNQLLKKMAASGRIEEIYNKHRISPDQENLNLKLDASKIDLTEAERLWLSQHKTIRMGVDPAYPPFDIVDANGRYRGMTADYIQLINERLGIEMRAVPDLTWPQVEEGLRKAEIDIAPALTETPNRKRYLKFTRPYISFPTAIVTRLDRDPAENLESFAGKKLALVKGYYYVEQVVRHYPEIEPVFVETPLEAIKAVSFGKADGLIENLAVVSYLLDENNVTNLRLDAEADIQSKGLAIGVRQDWPIFVNILNKALDSITQNEHRAIRDKWISIATKDSSAAPNLALTQKEKEWLRENPKITVANELDWPPFDFAENGEPKGLSIDLIRRVAKKTGMTLKFINGFTWAELVKKFNSREIDVLPAIYLTPERLKYMSFTSTYATNPSVLVTREDRPELSNLEDLNGLKVAVVTGFATADVMKTRFPEIHQVEVKNVLEGLKAVSFKRADAFIGSLGAITYIVDTTVIPEIRIVGEVWLKKREETELHMGILNENKVLRDILQKGLDAITKDEMRNLRRHWIPFAAMDATERVNLTEEERDWLNDHKTIRLGDDFAWPPFTFMDEDGRFSGIAAGYADVISERLGIEMEPVTGHTWKKVLEQIKTGELDVLPAVARTKAREEFLNFTKPYISFPIVVATRKDGIFVDNLGDLTGRKVGIVEGYVTQEILARDYPELILVPSGSLAEGLKDLNDRKVDAFVDNLGSITFEMNSHQLNDLKIAAPTDYRFELSIGVRKDWPQLAQILDKALETIDERERSVIKNTWMALEVKFGIDLKTILIWAIPIGGSALAIIFFVIVWNRRLGVEVQERKRAQAKEAASHKIITDSIEYASRIQRSVLPDDTLFQSLLSEYFVLWKPRDVVGGDIYWSRMWGDGMLIVLGDCTGHGVPGAFMTLIATGALDNALTEVPKGQVSLLMQKMHQLVQITLGQHGEGSESDDGMELGMCYLGPEMDELTFVGARFELYMFENGKIDIIKGTKSGIGYHGINHTQEFDEHKVVNLENKTFFITSDGLIDQVGGVKSRMYGKKRFRKLLLSIQDKPMSEQKDIIYQALVDFQGDQNRRDDVSVIGFKV